MGFSLSDGTIILCLGVDDAFHHLWVWVEVEVEERHCWLTETEMLAGGMLRADRLYCMQLMVDIPRTRKSQPFRPEC